MRIGVSLLALCLLAAGCEYRDDTNALGNFDEPPDVVGQIRQVEGGRILVVPKRAGCGYWLSVDDTRVLDYDVFTDARVLSKGQRVRVWIDGTVAASCPAQGLAEAIEIVYDAR